MPKLADLLTPEMLARLGAQRSGMADAAASVGAAGATDPQREALARSIAARGAQASGVGNAAAMVGAGPAPQQPSRGQMIQARRQQLMGSGMTALDAMRQMSAEGLVSPKLAELLTRAPSAVPKM